MLNSCSTARRRRAGFSLIELLVALVIAGTLAALVLPGFERQLQRMRRVDALTAAWQIQTAEERYRSRSPEYGSLAEIGAADRSAAGHYRLALNVAAPDGYELLASATGLQARDTACRFLKLSATGLDVARSSGPDAKATNDPAQNRRCWELR